MSIFGRSQEVDVSEPDAGVCNARLIETPYRDPDLATPERLAEVRRAGVPEAPFTDFELLRVEAESLRLPGSRDRHRVPARRVLAPARER